MSRKFLRVILGEGGYGLVELLLAVAGVAALAVAVLTILLPKILALHERAATNIRDFGGSGF